MPEEKSPVSYDSENDILYIRFTDKKTHECKEITDDIILDLDKEGNVLGIEIMNVNSILKDYEC